LPDGVSDSPYIFLSIFLIYAFPLAKFFRLLTLKEQFFVLKDYAVVNVPFFYFLFFNYKLNSTSIQHSR